MAKRYYPDSERRNPFRKLDWRWQRADRLVAERRPFLPHRDDAATGRCMAYIRDRQRGGGLPRRHHDLDAAHAVHAGGGDSRVALEARILAGQTDAEIAAKVGLTPAAVAAFHDSFFDVRDLVVRRAIDWIVIRACGHTPGSLSVANPQVLLRLLGFFGGPFVLDRALPFLSNGYDIWADALPAGVEPVLGHSMRRALRLRLLPDTPDTRSRLLRATSIVMVAESRGETSDLENILFGPQKDAVHPSGESDSMPEWPRTGDPIDRSGAIENLLHKQEVTTHGLGAA